MKTWNELSITDKNDIIKVAVQNGITTLPEIRERYNEFAEGGPEEVLEKVNSSSADFVQRLKDPNRTTIQDWSNPNYVATHKLSVGTDEQGNNYIYHEVQNIDGKLVDFTRPPYSPWIGMAAAEERGDTVRVNNLDDAIRFTETYKQYYPSFNYSSGGKIHIKPSKRGTFTAAASRHGMGVQAFASKVLAHKENYSPAMVKKANFAKNASKWHGDGGRLFAEGGEEDNEEYYPIWLDGITVKPSGNRLTTRDDWSWANWRELQNEREQKAAESVRRGIDRNGTPIAAGIYGLAATPFAIESLGSSAVANGVRTGLQAMNTAFTPSTWLNPVTGAKLLSPTVGTVADAGVQGAFAYEGLNGLWNQGKQGTLLSDPANTFMHSLEVLPLVGPLGYAAKSTIGNRVKPFVDFLWNDGNVIQRKMPYNPDNFYREVSKEAIDDAISSGVVRTGDANKYMGPYFAKGSTPWRREKYIIEGYPNKNDWVYAEPYQNAIWLGEEDASLGKKAMEEALNHVPKPQDASIGVHIFPYTNGSVNSTPTSNFTYWQRHPIIGWRQHSFNYGGPLVEYARGGHLFDNGGQYTVSRGDSLWKIAHENNMPLSRLRELNPQVKGNMIHPGDVLRLSPEFERQIVNLREERQREEVANMDNFTAIQAAPHDSNYVVVDKPNKKLQVYDRDNNLVYESSGVSFGKSGDDYNTITYVNANGSIRNNAGNNSTPAGISVITGVGSYHGLPSFTRGRINDDGTVENIASSIHYGNTEKKNMSNGCVRANSDTLKELSKYVGEGTTVYTLPEQKGSKFSVKNNKLNYTADNPFGMSEGPQRYWDDYNVRKDKSYSPLAIVYNGDNYDDEYNANVLSYTNALSINKEALQKRFNLSSDEYNRLAELAVGIAEQESKFGTSIRYKAKQQVPDEAIALAKNFKDSDSTNMFYRAGEALSRTINGSTAPARSRGLTQIKIGGDNKEMQGIYNELGINENTINNPYTSALATLSRLAYMYNSEVKGRDFKGAGDTDVSPYDALLYKYMGRGSELKNKTATPDKNNYIANVKRYASDFDFLEERLVEKR